MMNAPPCNFSNLDLLSEELVLFIFQMCELEDKYSLAFVSKKYRKIVFDRSLSLKDGLLDQVLAEIEKQYYDIAVILAKRILALFPNSPEVLKEIALCYKQKDELQLTLESLLSARNCSDEAYRHFIQSQIYVYIKSNGGDLALEEINKAISLEPKDLRYYHFRAFIESGLYREESGNRRENLEKLRSDSLDRELSDYEFIVSKPYKRMASIYNNLGAVYFEKNDFTKAIIYFDKATELCPFYLQAYYNRAIVCKELGTINRAIMEYNRVLEINPTLTRINALRGQCWYSLDTYPKAYKDFLISVEGDKVESDAVIGLFKAAIRTKQLNTILTHLLSLRSRLKHTYNIWEKKNKIQLLTLNIESNLSISEDDQLRLEAKKKALEKLKKDIVAVLQITLRFITDVKLLMGDFERAAEFLNELNPLIPSDIPELIQNVQFARYMMNIDYKNISIDVKKFTWDFISNLEVKPTYKKAITQLKDTSVYLKTHPEKIFFISCFSYFSFCFHTHWRYENYYKILKDIEQWIASKTDKDNLMLNRGMCAVLQHPFALLHYLEIFKKTKHDSALRSTLLLNLTHEIELIHPNDKLFYERTNNLIGNYLTRVFPGQLFRSDNF